MAKSIGGAIGGFFAGGAMFLAAFPVLFMNEGCAVRIAKSLDEGLGAVNRNVPADTVDPAFEGKLVHMSAPAKTTDTLRDDRFGVEFNGIKLQRRVEMYQWNERKRTQDKRTIYEYDLKWMEGREDSSRFHNKTGHINPALPFKSQTWTAKNVSFGAHRLPKSLVQKISGFNSLEPDVSKIPEPLRNRLLDTADGLYLTARAAAAVRGPEKKTPPPEPKTQPSGDPGSGPETPAAGDPGAGDPGAGDPGAGDPGASEPTSGDPGAGDPPVSSEKPIERVAAPRPELGDVRIIFSKVDEGEVSIVAQQRGDTFQPFPTSVDIPVEMLSPGVVSADQMFTDAKNANIIRTWAVRAGGGAMMFFGVLLMFSPLTQFSDYVPILGNIVGGAVAIVAFLVAAGCALITISIAWLFYRPLLGVPLLIVGVLCICGLIYFFFFRDTGDGPQKMQMDDGIREIN